MIYGDLRPVSWSGEQSTVGWRISLPELETPKYIVDFAISNLSKFSRQRQPNGTHVRSTASQCTKYVNLHLE